MQTGESLQQKGDRDSKLKSVGNALKSGSRYRGADGRLIRHKAHLGFHFVKWFPVERRQTARPRRLGRCRYAKPCRSRRRFTEDSGESGEDTKAKSRIKT